MFKSYTYTWWQIGIFKLALLTIGILFGAHWSELWNGLTTPLLIIAIVTSAYVLYVSLKQ